MNELNAWKKQNEKKQDHKIRPIIRISSFSTPIDFVPVLEWTKYSCFFFNLCHCAFYSWVTWIAIWSCLNLNLIRLLCSFCRYDKWMERVLVHLMLFAVVFIAPKEESFREVNWISAIKICRPISNAMQKKKIMLMFCVLNCTSGAGKVHIVVASIKFGLDSVPFFSVLKNHVYEFIMPIHQKYFQTSGTIHTKHEPRKWPHIFGFLSKMIECQ